VTSDSPEAIELCLDRSAADAFVAECLTDEPEWKDILHVVPIELDAQSISPNWD
jgi:hypothetical protein